MLFTFSLLSTILITTMILISNKKKYNQQKSDAFECGFTDMSSSKLPFSFQYFMILILFVVFDVEVSMLIPFSLESKVSMNKILIVIILITLAMGITYEWKSGALEWSKWMIAQFTCIELTYIQLKEHKELSTLSS